MSWEIASDRPDGSLIEPTDDTGFPIWFRPTREQKSGPNQMHFHLTSTSLEDQRQTVALVPGRAGLRRVGRGRVLLERGAGLALVWDQDQETAIRAPHGGPKISWGGPPQAPKTGKDRLHFDLVPSAGGDQAAEAGRLAALGATRADIGQGEVSWLVMADPDGHEFCLRLP